MREETVVEELVQAWREGPYTASRARELLAPHRREGTLVCSDTAGYSRLGRTVGSAQMLQIVAPPKAAIHALGSGLGGQAVGAWVTDNTEMIYSDEVSSDDLVRAMLAVHERPGPAVGMALHRGVFYLVGGASYGPDAAHCYRVAELHCGGGQTVVTESFRDSLADPDELVFSAHGHGWQVSGGEAWQGAEGSADWPDPFPIAFRDLMAQLDIEKPGPVLTVVCQRWERSRAVLLLKRWSAAPVRNEVQILDQITADAALRDACVAAVGAERSCVRGPIAVLTTERPEDALDAGRAVQERASRSGLSVSCGIDYGPILHFMDGPEYAGDAVNTASKLAEDLGRPGAILLTRRASEKMGLDHFEKRFWRISGVEIEAREVR